MKRVFALVLCLCMVLAMVPAVSAAETGNVTLNSTAYTTVEEALAVAAEGDTITLQKDMSANQIIIPKNVTLDLNGNTLTADMLIVFNGTIVNSSENTGKIVVAQNLMKVIGDNNSNLPVWNEAEACYTLATVRYQQMIKVAEDLSSATYIFIPNFDAATTAMLADGGKDNGISVKVLLSWNEGSSQQIYTFSEEMLATVYSSANANGVLSKVFQLSVTGIADINDMTICAVVDSTAGGKAVNEESKVALPEPEPTVPETEPTVPETEPTTPAEPVISEVVLTVDSLGLADQSYTASTATVGGVDFEWIQLGNYGNGIQVRDKDGKTSMLWNTSAFSGSIKEIRLVANAGKTVYNNPDCAIYSFGNEAGNYTYETKLSTVSGVMEYVITPEGDYNFFKFEHDLGYTQYWDSITIVIEGEGGSAPVEPTEPEATEPEVTEPEATEPADDFVLTIEEAIAMGGAMAHNTYTTDKYYVTGVITEVYNTTYGNMKITDDAGNILTIYGTYSADGSVRYDAMDVKPVAGDTVTIYGIVGQYNNTPQIKNGWITEHTVAGGTTEPTVPETEPTVPETEPTVPETEPTEPAGFQVVDAPVAGTAYKFGMIQKNVSETDVYYLDGNMSSYYMATTTDTGAAVDVYLEETEGGYYLYAMVGGAKKYINMVVSGTYVNGKYEDAASTVYTYNADSKTVIAVVNDADYWMGTRNDKTYTTVGPVKTSYNGFYMQFYAEVATEPEVPETTEPTVPETEPTVPETEPTVPETEPTVPETEPTVPAESVTETFIMEDYKVSGELGGAAVSRNLGDKAVFNISSGWFTSEARIYKNQNGVIASTVGMSSVTLNIGYTKASTCNVYISEDGATWTEYQMDVPFGSEYADVTFDFANPVNYVKIDAPNAQVRIKTISITFVGGASEPSEPEATEPTVPETEPTVPETEPTVPETEPTVPETEPTVPETTEPVEDFVLTVEEAIAMGGAMAHNTYTTDKYYVTGEITEVYNTQYGNMRIKDAAGNILTIYGTYSADGSARYDAMDVKPVAGDTVTIYGIVGQYNGTPQVKNGWITEHIPAEGGTTDPTEPEVPADPEADSVLTVEQVLALGASKGHNVYTTGKYYVTGEITEVYNTQYGNMKITDDAGNILTIYGTYSADGSARYDAMDVKPVAGDTVTIYGIVGQYNGTPQVKNGWITEHIPAEGGATEPDVPETEPTVPETEPTVPETEPTTPVEPEASEVVLTVDSLGLASQSYSASTATVNGVNFEWIQLGNYGNGIQVRDKDGKTSMLWNTSAAGVIKEIRLVANGGKTIYNNPDCAIYSFGNEVDNYTYQTKLSTVSGVTEYVITPDGDYTFFKFEHDLGYTQYWDSITIVFAEETEAPVEPEEPTEPETEPTVPETEPTVPETEPTVPETEPTEPETDQEIVFVLGNDGDAAHVDGKEATTYTETNGDYTLSITGGTKMYTAATDLQGNGCIKLGTSKVVGGFSFTVADDVTSVKIAIAKYKANTTKVDINGTTYTLENSSNNGAYDVIEIDTSSTKTVTLTTVTGGVRAMVNSITFVIAG